MVVVDLKEYCPCITNENVAKDIYQKIIDRNPIENEIVINMEDMITMSIQCINIIFGGLYDYLGADKFHENLVLNGCSDVMGDFIAFILKERLKKNEEGDSEEDSE